MSQVELRVDIDYKCLLGDYQAIFMIE